MLSTTLDATTSQVPPRMASEDRRVILQDLFWRLAQVELQAGQPQAALQWAHQGLKLRQKEDLFTANLFVARGRAKEMLGRDRESAHDYFEALKINETLLQRTLNSQEER